MAAVQEKQVRLALIDWCDQVEAFLSTVETDVSLSTAKLQASTNCKLLGVFIDGALSGAFMVCIEHGETGQEMCVLWAAGRAREVDLTFTVMPMVEKIAASLGCKAVFFLTRRQGLVKKAEKMGFAYYETVMKKVL